MTFDDVCRMREAHMASNYHPPTEIRMTFEQYCTLREEMAKRGDYFELRHVAPYNKPTIMGMTIIIEDYDNDHR